MLYEMTPLEDEEYFAFEERFGGFNDFPPGWEEITSEQFAQSNFFVYLSTHIEYRQMLNSQRKPVFANLYYLPSGNGGYAISHDYWAKKVRFFKFGVTSMPHPGDSSG